MDVTLSVNKNEQKVEVTIPVKGRIIRAEEISDDMYVSIDLVLEVIERQVNKHKKKLIDKEQNAAYLQNSFVEEETDEDDEIKIVRSKRFAVKPMYPDDACIRWICLDITSMYLEMQRQKK